MTNFDLISIGDANLDVFINPSESETLCRINSKKCFISFSYADKIPVKSLEFSVGGNAANNAVGTKRLGINTTVVLTLGDDSTAKQIIETLQKEGVDITYVIQQPSTRSGFNVAITYTGERTIFSHKPARSYEFPVKLPSAPWVYLTSMGDSFRPFYNHVADWLAQNPEIKLGFNPGSRQIRAGIEQLTRIMKLTHAIFVNKREAEILTGFEKKEKVTKELLTALSNIGPKTAVITDGSNGSYAFDGSKFVHCGVVPVDAHERTGAGDAFGSGFLSATIKGKPIEEALMWGTANSASVIGYVGSQHGLLKEADMDVWLDRASSSGVKVGEF